MIYNPFIYVIKMETVALKQPIILHVELEDPTILQDLKRALKLMKGVGKISVKKTQKSKTSLTHTILRLSLINRNVQ